jgi:hypothetical protein
MTQMASALEMRWYGASEYGVGEYDPDAEDGEHYDSY